MTKHTDPVYDSPGQGGTNPSPDAAGEIVVTPEMREVAVAAFESWGRAEVFESDGDFASRLYRLMARIAPAHRGL